MFICRLLKNYKVKSTHIFKLKPAAKDDMHRCRDNYYLGLSNEGFHRLYYREWGDPKNDNTIICVHGVTRISHDFDVLAKKLSKKYRVICPDIVGRGNSDWFGNKENYNFIQYCADINALIAHLRVEKIHYFGTSMGGLIGMILAYMSHTPVESLILNDVGPDIKRTELRRMGEYIGKAPIFPTKKELYAYCNNIYQGYGDLLSENQLREMARYSAFKIDGGYRMHYDTKIGDAFRKNYSFFNFDLWKYWDDIECPILILRGSESTFFTADIAQAMVERASDASLVEIEGAGHTPPLKTAHEIKIIEKFYKRVIA
jgi:pimeloyl-ACP methyl ester carboxylesterase